MSKIEKLIAELCPEGVEEKYLGELCTIKTGKGITKNDAIEGGAFPIISGGKEPMGYYKTSNRKGNCVTISRVGANAGFVNFILVDFYLNDKCFSILFKENKNLPKYLFYYLKSIESKIIDLQSEGGVPTINTVKVGSLQIPIPPLPIQEEIVRILDKFTALEAELEAELEARKRQYEYYRKQLLAFEDKEVEWKTLGEVGELKAGKSISSTKISNVITDNQNYVCIGGNGVRGYVSDFSHSGEFPIIGRQGALCGNLFFANGEFYATEHAVVVKPLNNFNKKFLFYLLKDMNLNQYATGGAQPGLAVSNLNKLKIPAPPLEEQERIVNILNQFDALVNDISVGLPAEIKARKEQYEYYRGKLLTFQPLVYS